MAGTRQRGFVRLDNDLFLRAAELGLEPIDVAIVGVVEARRNQKSGRSYASYATIGASLGRTGDAIKLRVRKMRERGLLLVGDRQHDGRGYPTGHNYDFGPLFERLAADEPLQGADSHQGARSHEGADSHEGVESHQGAGYPANGEPSTPEQDVEEQDVEEQDVEEQDVEEQDGVSRSGPPDAVTELFEHWRQVFGLNGMTKLTTGRRRRIEARLAEGYSIDRLKRAVEGCAGSDFHTQNGHTYLELICRNGEKVERFEAMPGPGAGRPAEKAPARASHRGDLSRYDQVIQDA